MNIRPYLKAAEKFTTDNSPLILTAIGAAGVLTTAILAAKGGIEAKARIDAELERRKWEASKTDEATQVYIANGGAPLTTKEMAVLTWSCYAPACGAGAFTIAAIVASNRISTKRAAAMAAAYSLSIEAFDEYRDKVKEKLSERKEQTIRDEIQQDRVNANPPVDREIIITDENGNQTCHDSLSGRYFQSSREAIDRAVNLVNNDINHEGYASLTDFYTYLQIPRTAMSDEIGWTSDRLLEVDYTAVVTEKGKTALSIVYRVQPIREFFRTH